MVILQVIVRALTSSLGRRGQTHPLLPELHVVRSRVVSLVLLFLLVCQVFSKAVLLITLVSHSSLGCLRRSVVIIQLVGVSNGPLDAIILLIGSVFKIH